MEHSPHWNRLIWHTLRKATVLMKSVPRFLKGAFRKALEIAINAATSADELTAERGWKLFIIPRMLLHRPARKFDFERQVLTPV